MSVQAAAVSSEGRAWSRLGCVSSVLAVLGAGLCLTVIGLAAGVVLLAAALALGIVAEAGRLGGRLAHRARVAPTTRHDGEALWGIPPMDEPRTMRQL